MFAKRILLSNHPDILRPMETSLFHRDGFSLLIADDGRQAFEIIEEHDPALAILDLDMMHGGGDHCCQRVKRDPILRHTPVILVAQREGADVVQRCREAGCNEIIFKPVDPQSLVTAACRLLRITERRAPRVDLAIPAHVGRPSRRLRPGTIRNLNGGGAFIEAERLLPVDTEVVLEFTLPGNEMKFQTRCRVAWVNHPEWLKATRLPVGMGLQFVALPEENDRALTRFLAEEEHCVPTETVAGTPS